MSYFHYVNGRIVPEGDSKISVFDLGLLRGYGVFDYAQLYSGRPFHLKEHIERLARSAEQLQLELPLSLPEIEQVALNLIDSNPPINAGIRFVITGGLCSNDLLTPRSRSSLIILFHPFTSFNEDYYQKGMRALTVSIPRFLSHVKSTHYVPAIFAMNKARAAGVDDALYLNKEGGIIEGTTCNVFFVKKGVLITDNSSELIRGVTREIILNLAQGHYQIEFRSLTPEEAASCDEAFLTSSVKDVIPLVEIDGKRIGKGLPGPLTAHLRVLFHQYIEHYFHSKIHQPQVLV